MSIADILRRLSGTLANVDIFRIPFYYLWNACCVMSVLPNPRSRPLPSKAIPFILLRKEAKKS